MGILIPPTPLSSNGPLPRNDRDSRRQLILLGNKYAAILRLTDVLILTTVYQKPQESPGFGHIVNGYGIKKLELVPLWVEASIPYHYRDRHHHGRRLEGQRKCKGSEIQTTTTDTWCTNIWKHLSASSSEARCLGHRNGQEIRRNVGAPCERGCSKG